MIKRRLSNAVTMLLVCGLSLLLVVYVGFGEAQRTYSQFHVEKLHAQGKILQTAMASYLRAGLPLRHYVGFATRADAILASDSSISAMAVFDQSGRPVFASGDHAIPLLPALAEGTDDGGIAQIDLRQDDEYLQVVLPLRNKFEIVGSLAVTTPRATITLRLEERFQNLLITAGILSVAFAWFASVVGPRLAGRRAPWLQIGYAMTFVTMSGMVVGTLVAVYSEGAQAKTMSLADSLGQRLRDIVDFNININELDGLDRVFNEYRRLNPDISAAGLIVNGQVVIHTDPAAVGRPWVGDRRTYEYVIDLTRPDKSANQVHVAVALPTEIVLRQVVRSVKNFGALFVASAFLAGLFLHLARSLQWLQFANAVRGGDRTTPEFVDFELSLVKAVFFVAVLAEHLTYSFLPQFVTQLLTDAGMSTRFVSAPFMAYYLCFALSLIPAGHYAQHVGARRLIYFGLTLAAGSLLSLAYVNDLLSLMLARAVAGIGQGTLFIGIQCYILAKASPGKKTQGAAIIVYGFQGGMISGMAIGSLLVVYMGAQGIFTLAGAIAAAAAIYTILLVPSVSPRADFTYGVGSNLRRLGHELGRVLRSLDFIRTIFLIGIPAKAVMTGIIIFALPLLLARQAYAQEDIGQIIMLYAVGVLVASTYISRLVDRIGKTEGILFWGSVISGLGLLLIGLSGWARFVDWPSGRLLVNVAMIAGVTIVGLAHGFINAPVVTRVADSKLAMEIGPNSATANYRFLERVGHVAGPIIVGQLFLIAGQDATVVSWIGGAIVFFGLVFILSCTPANPNPSPREFVHERGS
ncbi:MAG: MFS transporter [Kiloniellaceae bacterium]